MTTRTKGRLAALLILLVALGVTGLAVLNARRAASGGPTADGGAQSTPFQAPPTDKTVTAPLGEGGQGGPVQDLVSMAEEAVFTRVNRETGELEYRMTWESLDPQEGGVFRLTSPRAWIYQPGRTIEVTAQTGRLRWPSREREPESGLLEGDVLIVARERTAAPGLADEQGQELMRVRTANLNFHSTLGELRTAESVRIDSPGVTMTGKGLTLRFSQERARPLTYFRIDEGGHLDYAPTPDSRTASAKPPRTESAGPGKPDKPTALPGTIALYRAQFSGNVRLASIERTVESEQALIWARLVDGRLTPQAVGGWERARSADRQEITGKPESTASTEDLTSDGAFTLQWTGPFEARAVLEEPQELATDDVFLRLLSPSGGGVRMADLRSGASVKCVTFDYGATTRAMALFGAGPVGVTLSVPDQVEVATGRFEVNLTNGIGALPSPGIAKAIGRAADVDDPAFERGQRPREIRWQDRVDFRLDAEHGPVGSGGTITPRDVVLSGAVEAREGAALLQGDSLRVVFAEADPNSQSAAEPSVSRLVAEGSALAQDGTGGRITADSLDVAFEQDQTSGRSVPAFAGARGAVHAERAGESLRAGMVDATLATDAKGRTEIASLEARLGVETRLVRREAGEDADSTVEVKAERMSADRSVGVVELQGSPATIGRTRGAETMTISGASMRLEDSETARGLTVFGAGAGAFTIPQKKSGGYATAQIDWRGSMVFDDRAGRVEALGEVAGFAEMGEVERHTLKGQRVLMTIGPDSEGKRSLTSALVEGAEPPGEPAEVELRRYAPRAEGGPPKLEGMAFMRGPAIELDAVSLTLKSPGAGLLLIEDRRDAASSPPGQAELGAHGARGTTVFEWKGGMALSRTTGEGQMDKGVRVRHRHAGIEDITELQCETLRVFLAEAPAGSDAQAMRLERAEAIGAVFARHKTLQLVADRMDYDASRGVIIAAAAPGNRVTVYDEAKGRHFVAEAAEVDLATGSWKATRVSAQMFGR